MPYSPIYRGGSARRARQTLGHVRFLRPLRNGGAHDWVSGYVLGPYAFIAADMEGQLPVKIRRVQFGHPDSPKCLVLWAASQGGTLSLLTTSPSPSGYFDRLFEGSGLGGPQTTLFTPLDDQRSDRTCNLWVLSFPGSQSRFADELREAFSVRGFGTLNPELRHALPEWAARAEGGLT